MALLPCSGCDRPTAEPLPDIILITIDTLRWDHVSSYGYERSTTPFLDSLAASGVRFTRGYSTSSWTVPAVASLMTSLQPESHGVVSGTVTRGKVHGQQVLAEDLTRLPGLLRDAGYTTFGITANGHLTRRLGYAQGFDRYENLGFGASADEVGSHLELWRDEIERSAPYFVWLHYFDPHTPYVPRVPWLVEFAPDSTMKAPGRLTVRNAGRYEEMGLKKHTPDFNYVVALYDSEIGYTDDAIRKAVRLLDPASDDLVLVTSDHGEGFLDHGEFGHGGSLFEEQVRVPLIVRFPAGRARGRVVEDPVSLVDVGPSLLDFLDIDIPDVFQGRSFVPLVEGERRDARPIVISLDRSERQELQAVVQGDWKYVRYIGARSEELLYHLGTDPTEQENVAGSSRLKKVALAELLQQELTRYSAEIQPEVLTATEEKLEELRSLGYVQ
jgi:arylsulfatase A-like enzyme